MDGAIKKQKPRNPREHANPLSAATFTYTIPTFIQGYRRDLEVTDLHETLTEHKSSRLGDKIEKAWMAEEERALKANRKPSLRRVLMRQFGAEFMIYGVVLAFTELLVRLNQPILLGRLVRHFSPYNNNKVAAANRGTTNGLGTDFNNETIQPLALGQLILFYTPNQTEITEKEAYLYAGGVVLCSLLNVFLIHPYMMGVLHMGMKLRVACCSLIYRKSLKLSKTALRETTAGQVVNLLSNDVNRFDVAVIFAHFLWVGPLETILVTYFMYQQVGVSAVIGVVFLLLFVPLQIWLGKMTSILRLKTAIRTDERVRLMNEIISGIQVIKMYTWERPFANLVALARKYEIKWIRATSYMRGILLSFIMFTTRISIFASILAYVLFGYNITAEQVFVLTSFYNILRQSMTVFFPQGIAQVAEASVSIRRLNNFMLYEETQIANETKLEKKKLNGDNGIFIKNATAKWTESGVDNTLTNVTLNVTPGQLLAVIGPVGSGKTSLLHAILKELPLKQGSVEVKGEISYASQEPWLFAGSVRQNILFGLPMDKERYRTVVKVCALERDFSLLPYGDKTIVGERGVSLSGGQRARINLARAVYKEADVYLLDDPLSAVDTHVGKELFENCVTGFLRDKTCILITHQLQYLKEVDHIIILESGMVKAEGTYNDLQESGLDFANLLEKQSEVVDEIEPAEASEQKEKIARQASVRSISSDKTTEAPLQVEEQKSKGTVAGFVYKAYFKAGGNCCVIATLFALFALAQIAASAGDYFITHWVNLEQKRAESGQYNATYSVKTTNNNSALSQVHQLPQYSKANNDTESNSIWDFSRDVSIYIYSGITAATVIVTLIRSFTFFTVCMRASTRLHNNMFNSITRATMRFFNTNTSGRILNRFSKDMGAIDELLPAAMIDCLQIGLALLGIIIVVAIVNPWLMLPTVLVGVIFYVLRNFYLATSRSVKRLEGVTRSPVFAHLNASLQGLTTIRAFRAEGILEKEFDNHQDLHSSAWFNFIATSRAFGFWLDLVCIIYIAVVTLSFLVIGNERFGGNVGLAITQSIGLTGMFQWGMRQSTELENQMTSVERVLEYTNIEQEKNLETPPEKKPRPTWPEHGEIKFINLYLRYNSTDSPVLKNLNFAIKPQEKVGIVGRTGAGKSSLIAALFQLTETEGSILIDGINTKDLGLHDLRAKISIIPQEPVLFSGTMRKNLDPFDEYTDAVLWRALEDVELKEVVEDLVAGLESKVSEGGSNFSVGQRQLVCLARAIIRKNKILVLDEATANVDPQTDGLIQTTIRKKFADCTVLTIAHRLHTVMDSDKVLVMDAGKMVEFDQPFQLLQNKQGVFYGMVQQTGKAMADALYRIAEQSSRKQQQQLLPL